MRKSDAMRIWLTRSFKPFLFLGEADEELRFRDVKKLGLYIHVPFCETICGFCPYCKCPYDREKADRYIDALLLETEMVAGRGEGRAEATSLYFGGGSPALAHGRMAEIIEAVRKRFRITEGIGVELHPREVNEEILSSLKRAGVSKISVGMQSFHEGCLSFLGRPSHDIPAMRAALEKTPFETVSIDLIFAMPGQTFETLKRDVDTAFAIGANHVALYPFIDFSFADKHAAPVAGREKKALLYRIVEYCESRGCHRTSIWTFSRDGGVYSSMTRDNFLGFGCSATSLLMDRFKINTFSVDEYIKRCESGRLPTSLTLRFTRRQRMVYYLFWTAYGTRIDPRGFETFFGVPLEKEYGFEMLLARAAGLIERKNGIYELTRRGVYYYHYFEQFYTLAYIDKMWGIMRETPFPERITL